MTTEMKEKFHYAELTDLHKKIAEEIANLAKDAGHEEFYKFIIKQFQIEEPIKYNLEESVFVEHAVDAGLYVNIQGWIIDPNDGVHYPIVSMSEDIRKLNAFTSSLIDKK
jgi:carbonic anhydrase